MNKNFFPMVTWISMAAAMMGCAENTSSDNRAPNPQPLADLRENQEASQKMEVFTGMLEGGVMAIGGETTGWRLVGDGEAGALMVDVSAVNEQAEKLNGQRVTITGHITTRDYVERGKVTVLIAKRIQPAE